MVVESHLFVLLEVNSLEASSRSINREPLVVDTEVVAMDIRMGEET